MFLRTSRPSIGRGSDRGCVECSSLWPRVGPGRGRRRGAVRRRAHAPLRQPRLRGEHAGDGRRVGGRRGVRAVVQQRPPRHRLEVALSTAAYEDARGAVAGSSARRDGTVVLVRNTTEAINVLAAALPAGTRVLSHAGRAPREHAAVAPPRPCACCRSRQRPRSCSSAASTRCGRAAADRPARRHRRLQRHRRGVAAGRARRGRAPLRRQAVRRRRPARAAPRDRHGGDGHRLPRALRPQALRAVRRRRAGRCGRALERGDPLLHGGGAIKLVTLDDVIWADAPERYEAGSPNVIGAVALGAACRMLGQLGMARVAAQRARPLRAPGSRPGARRRACRQLALWPDATGDRVGVATFTSTATATAASPRC